MKYHLEVWEADGQSAVAQATVDTFPGVLAWFDQHGSVDPTLIWHIHVPDGELTSEQQAQLEAKGKYLEVL